MKVLMLGWEYPPHITGGLGTACEGLSRGLARQGVKIQFVVPHLYGGEYAPHMILAAPGIVQETAGKELPEEIDQHRIPAMLSPYWRPEDYQAYLEDILNKKEAHELGGKEGLIYPRRNSKTEKKGQYSKNIFSEVKDFTDKVVRLVRHEKFDLIHAHDWMTFSAGIGLAQATKKPLLCQVHSLEYDRSGPNKHPQIDFFEREGTRQADGVVAVSNYTKSVICREHGLAPEKIHVVHNGIYIQKATRTYRKRFAPETKIVLFLGRVTFQKGPNFFVEAAAKVIPEVPQALFVLAGTGDLLEQAKERVAELGVEQNFLFPGFLRGRQLEEMFCISDLYVMPSVSEPFGITPLEALAYDTPAIISKQSGVSEILENALKVDYWDVDRTANLIINALVHPEMREDMTLMGHKEVQELHWDAAGEKMARIYSYYA